MGLYSTIYGVQQGRLEAMAAESSIKEKKTSLIGDVLVKAGVITPEQLDRAVRIQGRLEQHRQLGEVLVELGYATRQCIADAISQHGKAMRIGEILVEQGLITEAELQTALHIQRDQGRPIGEVLVHMGAITERTLLQNVAHQAGVPYIEPSLGMLDRRVLDSCSPDYMEKFKFVPFSVTDDREYLVVVSDLRNDETIHAVTDVYQGRFRLALGPSEIVHQTIEEIRKFKASDVGREGGQEGSVTDLVNHILAQAIEDRASDVHIEPQSTNIRLRYRIDGSLVYKTDLPLELLPQIVSRIKIMAECDIAERLRHQGGRLAFEHNGEEFDMRLSIYVTVHGEACVIRVLNKQMGLVDLDELGMAPTMRERYKRDVLDLPTGVVMVTGPTGSGKTTTLYSCLDYCNSAERKIITAEDPVEFMIDGLVQCSTSDKAGRTFESSLREIVRQDPDIIVLGEIRDRQTAEIAIQAALTGHKVYTTFHTEDTIGGLVRLLNMEIEAFLISSTVISVVAQRLLRRICDQCCVPYQPTPLELARLGLDHGEIRGYEFKKGRGCKNCSYTGYRGRVGVYELLVVNQEVQEAILAKRSAHEIRQISQETTGLVSMREDGIAKVIRGHTTFEEVLRHTPRTMEQRPLGELLSMTK